MKISTKLLVLVAVGVFCGSLVLSSCSKDKPAHDDNKVSVADLELEEDAPTIYVKTKDRIKNNGTLGFTFVPWRLTGSKGLRDAGIRFNTCTVDNEGTYYNSVTFFFTAFDLDDFQLTRGEAQSFILMLEGLKKAKFDKQKSVDGFFLKGTLESFDIRKRERGYTIEMQEGSYHAISEESIDLLRAGLQDGINALQILIKSGSVVTNLRKI